MGMGMGRRWQEELMGLSGRGSERREYGEREDILAGRIRGMRRRRGSGSGTERNYHRGFVLNSDADLRRWTLERMHRDRLRSRMRDEDIVYG